jgi:hypothetical protein
MLTVRPSHGFEGIIAKPTDIIFIAGGKQQKWLKPSLLMEIPPLRMLRTHFPTRPRYFP